MENKRGQEAAWRNMRYADFAGRDGRQEDGITRVSDPFWLNRCLSCGHMFWSVTVSAACGCCGGEKLERTLGGVPYETVLRERKRPLA